MISKIQDVVNPDLVIYRHDASGFYCATKALKQFQAMHPGAPRKLIADWICLDQVKALIKAVKDRHNLQYSTKTIKKGPNSFQGTYIHADLYRAFLMWLSPDYMVSTLAVARKAQLELTARLEAESKAKDCKIDSLEQMIKKMRKENRKGTDEIKTTVHRVEAKMDTLTQNVDDIHADHTANIS